MYRLRDLKSNLSQDTYKYPSYIDLEKQIKRPSKAKQTNKKVLEFIMKCQGYHGRIFEKLNSMEGD